MHKAVIFIIQLCVVELFSLEDACGFIVETASFYITVESSGSMRMKYYGNHFKYLHGITYVELN